MVIQLNFNFVGRLVTPRQNWKPATKTGMQVIAIPCICILQKCCIPERKRHGYPGGGVHNMLRVRSCAAHMCGFLGRIL